MTDIIVACLITYSGWAIAPSQMWFKTTSIANCQKIAQTKHYGLVSYYKIFYMPKDRQEFEVQCGKDGNDCSNG